MAANGVRMKKCAGVLASWLLVMLLCYGALEVSVLHWLPKVFPLASVMNYLDPDVQVLAQSSKKSVVPENYIAILGDSYAFGQGDWLFNRQGEVSPAYNTTHLLHEKTGRDVVSFGRPASSNIKGYLEDPLSQYLYLRQAFALQPPAVAILYFYEGNDVVDNWKEFEVRYQGQGYDPARLQEENYFARFIDEGILAKNKTVKKLSGGLSGNHMLFGNFLAGLAVGETLRLYSSARQTFSHQPYKPIFKPQARDHNAVRVAGLDEKIPDRVQVPPLALHDDEIAVAITILEQSVRQLKKRWPDTRIGMVYVPAVATAYDVVSDTLNVYDTDRGKQYPSAQVLPASDDICRRVQAVALRSSVPFVDARPAIRQKAQQQFVHGPVDWLHFNETGYRVLAGEIEKLLGYVEQQSDGSGCVQLAH